MTDYLILVNSEHTFDKSFLNTIQLKRIRNVRNQDTFIESETYDAVIRLINRLKQDGLIFGIGGVFRTVEYQQEIMEKFTLEKGIDYALKYVAVPGLSEHHTGLAIDLLPFIDGKWHSDHATLFASADLYSQVHKYLPEFGFILRYPKEKENITGISYEPWHIRYVGVEAAMEITQKELCLEEYV